MKTCSTCGTGIYHRNKSGLCRSCIAHDPAIQAKRAEGMRRAFQLRPELLVAATERIRAATKTPEHAERARRMMKEGRLWERGVLALGPAGSPVRQRAGKTVSNTRLNHIPRELRDEYRHLVNIKRFSAAEAQSIVLEQHEREIERFRQRIAPTPPAPTPTVVFETAPVCPVTVVASIFGIDRDEIIGPRRFPALVDARTAAVVLMRKQGLSYSAIGRQLGDRDHTSIKHLDDTKDRRVARNPLVRAVLAASEGLAA